MNWRESPGPMRDEQSLITADTVGNELSRHADDLSNLESLPIDHPLRISYAELIDVNSRNEQTLDDIRNATNAPDAELLADFSETDDLRMIVRHPFQVIKGAWRAFKLLNDPEASRLMFGQPRAFTKIGFGYYQDGLKLAIVRQMTEDLLRSRTTDEMTEDALEMLARISTSIDTSNGIGDTEGGKLVRREDLFEASSTEDHASVPHSKAFTHSDEYVGVQDFIKNLTASVSQYEAS